MWELFPSSWRCSRRQKQLCLKLRGKCINTAPFKCAISRKNVKNKNPLSISAHLKSQSPCAGREAVPWLCCVVLRCPVCLESSRLSDCQLLSPHFAVQLVPSVSRPAENKILPSTGSWMLKHVSSQVGLVLGYRSVCSLSFNDARQCETFKAHPQVYIMFLCFCRRKKTKPCAIKALFWDFAGGGSDV